MKKIFKLIPKKIIYFLNTIIYYYIIVWQKINKQKHNKKLTEFNKIKIMENKKVIDLIIKEKKSLTRIGDGEIKWIFQSNHYSFQNNDRLLAKRLKEILTQNNPNLIIGLPDVFNDLSIYNRFCKIYWTKILHIYFNKFKKYINYEKEYANTLITRPYIDYVDKTKSKQSFINLKKIWNNKNIYIVEGEYSKLGIGNDLFNNAKNIKRIICPAQNAFECYDEILNSIINLVKDEMILLSLGPSAAVLAYDLSNLNYHCIDIGHIDIEYEWYLKKSKKKEKIIGKYVNEVNSRSLKKNEQDSNYIKSIIKKIGGE